MGLDIGCPIALRCENARRQSRSKIFSKNFSIFFKTCLLHVSGLWDNFKRKKFFSDFQTNLSPDIAMRSQRQEFPFTCNQRRGTLSVRITWKGDWSSGVSLRCQSASLGKKFFKKIFNSFSKRVLSMFQDSGIILSKKIFFPTFRPI